MLQSRLVLAALGVGALTAFGATAPPKTSDKASESPRPFTTSPGFNTSFTHPTASPC